ncbi:unnamed protein product [Leptidea sinapis]|uniref:Uncharacterized protein n=1 Tax=Leptidea sinapis TaxID=189913 RepID=A0A5E4Q1V5_9NEOP|nr:unnamed protein product [Leptidea sinapis]
MDLNLNRFAICLIIICAKLSESQRISFRRYDIVPTNPPLPFPACRADDIECLRRGFRTFFFLMNEGHMGMHRIDPLILNSVSVAVPNEQVSFVLRKVNVTGATWSKLSDRKFNNQNGKNSVRLISDLHVTGVITMRLSRNIEPAVAFITMDFDNVESNITYSWYGQRGYDNEDYIVIGQERIAVRNSKTPLFFLQPGGSRDSFAIEQVMLSKTAILDHLANEITVALMHAVVDNFRIFAATVPVKNYYIYNYK